MQQKIFFKWTKYFLNSFREIISYDQGEVGAEVSVPLMALHWIPLHLGEGRNLTGKYKLQAQTDTTKSG